MHASVDALQSLDWSEDCCPAALDGLSQMFLEVHIVLVIFLLKRYR